MDGGAIHEGGLPGALGSNPCLPKLQEQDPLVGLESGTSAAVGPEGRESNRRWLFLNLKINELAPLDFVLTLGPITPFLLIS